MAVPTHPASEADLNERGRRKLDAAYRRRTRSKASHDDFADGYVAALVDEGSWALFATPFWQLAPPAPQPDAGVQP
jgi:hypothetical protein